jgi:hypothetical protein
MSSFNRISFLLLIATALLTLGACKEDTVGPGPGSGNYLEATVNNSKLSFAIDLTASPASYDTAAHRVSFNGTIVGSPTKTVQIIFTFDIDKGIYPTTLTGSDVSMVYIEGTSAYNCDLTTNDCTVTMTSHSGDIVDGTFQGLLKGSAGTVVIKDGKFSAKLRRG